MSTPDSPRPTCSCGQGKVDGGDEGGKAVPVWEGGLHGHMEHTARPYLRERNVD